MSEAKEVIIKENITYVEKLEIAFSVMAGCFLLETILLRQQIAEIEYTWQLTAVVILSVVAAFSGVYFCIRGSFE